MYRITSPLDESVNKTYQTLKECKHDNPTWFAYYTTHKTTTGLQLVNGRGDIIADITKQ
jgi:hypothetical protein